LLIIFSIFVVAGTISIPPSSVNLAPTGNLAMKDSQSDSADE
jgi:hypothetical protein